MGARDIITKDYMDDAGTFADVFNAALFKGRQVVEPSRLHTMDTTAIGMPYGEGGTKAPVQKFRDGLKFLAAKEDGTAAYLILGIEAQTGPHYAMPVRNMVYDALQYASQVEKAAQSHRRAAKERADRERLGQGEGAVPRQKGHEGPSPGEYLSGFYKGDRLVPVVTLVVFFNPDPWDGPMSIHEMLSVGDEEILSFVPDYRINLIAPAQIEAGDMDRFKSSLREVLLYIRYSKDEEKLQELLATDPHFRALDRRAAVVINTVTNSKLVFDEKEGTVDMCQAIAEMREKERREGRQEGSQEEKKEIASRMLRAGRLSIEEIAEYVGLSIAIVKGLAVR